MTVAHLDVPGSQAWVLDHIGHVVTNLDESTRRYTELAGGVVELKEDISDQLVQVAFIRIGGSLIELIAPLAGNTNLQSFLKKRGEGLHHLCFKVNSVDAELGRLKTAGIEVIDANPRNGSRGLKVAFLHPRACSGVLIELCSEK